VRIGGRPGRLPRVELQQTLGGRYKLLNELGSGGMAVVWRGRDEVLGRPVAVKVLAGRFAGDPQSRARIRDEARHAATLSHPNIAQVYDYGESAEGDTPLPYVVMELINGPTLQQRVAGGPLPPRTVLRICGEVAAALAAAHADGLVHRDIKMANILVSTSGAKVVDFGISAAIGPGSPEDLVVGTPAYLAPERLTGAAVEPASDVYALGVLLYRLLAHHAPWSVETTTQMLDAHIYLEPAPLPQLPGVPPAVADLVARCLRKSPADRPSAAEVSAALGDAAEAAILQPPDPVRPDSLRMPRPAAGDFDEPTSASVMRHPTRTDDRGGAGAAAAGPGSPSSAAGPDHTTGPHPTASPTDTPDPAGGRPRSGRESAVGAGRAGAVGDGSAPVRHGKRKALVAGGGVAAALIAGLALWVLDGGGGKGETARGAVGVESVAPTPGSVSAAPRSAGVGALPAATGAGGRPPAVTGNGTAPAAGSSASATPAPAGVTTRPSASGSPTASTAPEGTRLTSPGGVVYAVCDQGKAALTGWEPAAGYVVQNVVAGPALTAEIVFRSPSSRYRMTVTCVAGIPTPFLLPL